jgi:hypothetical protein
VPLVDIPVVRAVTEAELQVAFKRVVLDIQQLLAREMQELMSSAG